MKYDYKAPHALFETLISLDPSGKPCLYFCVEGRESSFMSPASDEPSVVYHYCSSQTASSIINTLTIWLSDLFCTNDSREVTWFLAQFCSYVNSLSLTTQLEIQKIHFLYHLFRLNLMWGFAACFTPLRDSLYHWKHYGDQGRGLALGFTPRGLNITRGLPERHAPGECQDRSLSFLQVNYDEQAQLNLIKEIVCDVLNNKLNVMDAGFTLAKIAYTCKQQKWSSENEWRIVYTPLEMDQSSTTNTPRKLVSPIRKIPPKKRYAELYLTENIISEIIIGPKCTLSSEEIKNLRSPLHCNIRRSKIIYD